MFYLWILFVNDNICFKKISLHGSNVGTVLGKKVCKDDGFELGFVVGMFDRPFVGIRVGSYDGFIVGI